MKKTTLLFTILPAVVLASAYKLPEQSFEGTALSAANVASCEGADCAYYNSANISFLEPSKSYLEAGLTFIHLPSIEFTGQQILQGNAVIADAKSKIENVALPYFHYVSPAFDNLRYSLSITVPGGLRKRWDTPVQKLYAQEFELKTVSLTPSVAYKINKNFSLSVGANITYSEGTVKNDGTLLGLPIKREMKGDSIDYSFNLAASAHLDNGIKLSTVYKSKTKLTEEGEANLYLGSVGKQYDAKVDIYLPATFTFAIAKEFDKLNIEFVYERTFWSDYKELKFNYSPAVTNAVLAAAFDTPKEKNWRDTNTFRVGVKYKYNDKLTLLAGYSYDQTPIKDKYLSYELPDANAHIFSAGFSYQYDKKLTFGAGMLYDYKKEREISNNINGIRGEFSKGGAILATTGVVYKF
jgi:long-chain fatty acid transport protein